MRAASTRARSSRMCSVFAGVESATSGLSVNVAGPRGHALRRALHRPRQRHRLPRARQARRPGRARRQPARRRPEHPHRPLHRRQRPHLRFRVDERDRQPPPHTRKPFFFQLPGGETWTAAATAAATA